MSNRIIKDTIAITVITLVAGLALGVVQDITADPIASRKHRRNRMRIRQYLQMRTALRQWMWMRMPCSLIWMRTDMRHSP